MRGAFISHYSPPSFSNAEDGYFEAIIYIDVFAGMHVCKVKCFMIISF